MSGVGTQGDHFLMYCVFLFALFCQWSHSSDKIQYLT
jgi:hypothetical protein